MTGCYHRYAATGAERACPRPTADGHGKCVFHLRPEERAAAGVTGADLRAAVVADLNVDDPARREYVDVHLRDLDLDLSALIIDGDDVGHLTFRDVTIEGTLDLTGAVVRHPIKIEDAAVGRLVADRASFEMEVTAEGSAIGTSGGGAAVRARRGSFDRSLRIAATRFEGGVDLAACRIDGWLSVDDTTVAGGAHFPNLAVGTAQFVSTTFESGAEFAGATAELAAFERVEVGDDTLDLTGGRFEELRVRPAGALRCRLVEATVSAGRLDQPDEGIAAYDLTDATVGDVDIDCDAESFDRYRFYRTEFDGFRFPSYHTVFRDNRWHIHEYAHEPEQPDAVEGLEQTYLEAKQGAADVGDSETGSMFFIRELRYRRRRYAAHARAATHSTSHRVDAALRWVTNGFLDLIAGYGERPQRTAMLALAVILGCAAAFPMTEGLVAGAAVVTYASHGVAAVVDSLYFSIVTFATLGLGDVHPVGTLGRFIAAAEGLVGAFLTAVFVFSLGRRVTR